jgi:hypothetical protein
MSAVLRDAGGSDILVGFILGDDSWRRGHGNDERISLENPTEGVRCHPEMPPGVAAA